MLPHDVPAIGVDEVPDDAVILDVREDVEWRGGHIPGAVHIPMNDVPQRLNYEPGAVTPDAHVVVVCKVGGRSAQVTAFLRHHGYDAVNLTGGMLSWQAAGKPMEADGGAPPSVV